MIALRRRTIRSSSIGRPAFPLVTLVLAAIVVGAQADGERPLEDPGRQELAATILAAKIGDVLSPELVTQFARGMEPDAIELANGETLEEFITRVERDQAAGLIYHPLPPCLLLDTRQTGQRLVAGESRSLIVRGQETDYSTYGGSAKGCGIPGLKGSVFKTNTARALFLRVELFDAGQDTDLGIWPANSRHVASVSLIPKGSSHQVASSIIPLCDEERADPCQDGDLVIEARGTDTDVVIKVQGYFGSLSDQALAADCDEELCESKSLTSPFWEEGDSPGTIHYSDGRTAIGATNPRAMLDIVGSEDSTPNHKVLRLEARGESPSFRDHLSIVGNLESGYGLAFGGQGHHRGGLYAKNVGGTSSSTGEITLWSRGGGPILFKGGNIGIGTNSPEVKLDIVGNTRIKSSHLRFFNSHSSYPEGFHDSRFQQWGRLALSLRTEGNAFAVEKTDETGRLGTIAYFDRDSSNVGIGTTKPRTPLSIRGNGGLHDVGITQRQVGGGATMELTTTDSAGDQATRFLLRGGGDAASIEFYRGARSSEQLSLLVDGSTGNLGIGAATPLNPLSIRANGGIDQVGITQNQVGGPSTMELTTRDSGASQATRLLLRGGGDAANVEFYRGARGSEQLSVVIAGTNGRMGIGTDDPAAELDVVGDIKVSGNILSEGDICIGNCLQEP